MTGNLKFPIVIKKAIDEIVTKKWKNDIKDFDLDNMEIELKWWYYNNFILNDFWKLEKIKFENYEIYWMEEKPLEPDDFGTILKIHDSWNHNYFLKLKGYEFISALIGSESWKEWEDEIN